MQHVVKRHLGAVGIPEREYGVVCKVALMNLVVATAVAVVYVAEGRGVNHRVIEGGVQYGAGLRVFVRYLNLGKLCVPGSIGSLGGSVKIPTGELCGHVFLCAFHIYCRKGNLGKDLVTIGQLTEVYTGIERELYRAFLYLDNLNVLDRLVELSDEEDLLVVCPALGMTPTGDGAVLFVDVEAGVGSPVPATAVFKVNHYCSVLCGRESVTVNTHAVGGSHFGLDAVAGKRHAVISGLGDFLGAVGVRPQA